MFNAGNLPQLLNALEDAGFEIIFSGTQREPGGFWTRALYLQDINQINIKYTMAVSDDDLRYLSAKLDNRGEDAGIVYISLCVDQGDRADSPVIKAAVIETRPVEEGKVEVRTDTDALAEERSVVQA